MAGGELVRIIAVALYDAAQVRQASDRRAVAAREELEEAALLLVVKLPHDLPQPLHCLRSGKSGLEWT